MARPKKLTLDFFIHNANARHDRRIKALRRREQNDGYATYYILLEMSCSENNMKLTLNDELTIEEAVEECGLRDTPHLLKIIETCVNVGLFNAQLWRSERTIFSDDLYSKYIDRLEDRKATAERKNRKSEAKSIEGKLSRAGIITQENPVITQENPVITQENPVITQENSPEDQNTELQRSRDPDPDPKPICAYNAHTHTHAHTQEFQTEHEKRKSTEAELWSRSPIDCHKLAQDPEFVQFVLKNHLPHIEFFSSQKRLLDAADAEAWIVKGKFSAERRSQVEIQHRRFLASEAPKSLGIANIHIAAWSRRLRDDFDGDKQAFGRSLTNSPEDLAIVDWLVQQIREEKANAG